VPIGSQRVPFWRHPEPTSSSKRARMGKAVPNEIGPTYKGSRTASLYGSGHPGGNQSYPRHCPGLNILEAVASEGVEIDVSTFWWPIHKIMEPAWTLGFDTLADRWDEQHPENKLGSLD
jgi:hypothetical protein